jgi:hypothetical protein
MAKNFLANLKKNTHNFMHDVGIYYNKFEEVTLKVDVMPWILDKAESFVSDLSAMEKYPTICLAEYLSA